MGIGEGDGLANSIAAMKNPVHIPQSAYAHLASILIENPRAQAALGISRGSGSGSEINCNGYRSPQTPRNSRPIISHQNEEIILSDSDQDESAMAPHKRKRSDSPPSYYGPPHISRRFLPWKSPHSSSPAESFAVNLAQAFWPLSTHISTDQESWDHNLAQDLDQSKRLITGRLVRNPTDASDAVKRAGKAHYLWRIQHQVPGSSLNPRHYPSLEKRIQGFISRRSLDANQKVPPSKPGTTRLHRTISAQRNGRQLYDTESRLRLRHTFRTSGSATAIQQRGPHEAIMASSALKGTPDMVPDCTAEKVTIDPRSENRMGNVMYKKTSPGRSAGLDDLEDTLTWEVLRTHFQKAWVTTEEFSRLRGRILTRHEYSHFFSCTDTKFVPHSHQYNNGISEFVTTAVDGTVRLWKPKLAFCPRFEENDDGHQANLMWDASTYDTQGIKAFPSMIHFDPSPPEPANPLFVVTCARSGAVHLQSTSEHLARIAVSPEASLNNSFDTYACWGRGACAGWVFAGTDPSQDQQTSCRVVRFDTRLDDITGMCSQPEVFPLEKDFCQFLTTDTIGQRLAVVANDKFSRDLMLRIYDLRAPLASQSSLSLQCNLDALLCSSRSLASTHAIPIHRRKSTSSSSDDGSSSSSDEDERMNQGASVAAFSPDDTYIAIGRENNVTQVLDSRFARGNILVCSHHEAQHSGRSEEPDGIDSDEPGFGITALEWVDAAAGRNRSRNVLLTGGNDGAVRIWDLRRAGEDSGQDILSQCDGDRLAAIGTFHLGNVYEGESALIVGDIVGAVQEYVDFPG